MTADTAALVTATSEKTDAIEYIDDILALFERYGQPLDYWECFHLCEAVGWAVRGGYSFGAMHAYDALTPEDDRNVADYPLPANESYARADLRALRKALSVAEAEPVRLFPHFGPIVS